MLFSFLLILFVSGFVLWLIRPHNKTYAGWLSLLPPAAVAGWLLARLGPLAEGIVYTERVTWIPSLGVELAFRLDGLAILFGLIISVIGAGIVPYTLLSGRRPRTGAILRLPLCLHGQHVGAGVGRQCDRHLRLLGRDEHHQLSAHRLQAQGREIAQRRQHRAGGHRLWRAVHAGGVAAVGSRPRGRTQSAKSSARPA
ncbi:MAG: hypothetical protein R2856_32500 [Caldilineaceae bacterium]